MRTMRVTARISMALLFVLILAVASLQPVIAQSPAPATPFYSDTGWQLQNPNLPMTTIAEIPSVFVGSPEELPQTGTQFYSDTGWQFQSP